MKKASLLFSAFLLIGMLFSTQMMAQGRIDLGRTNSTSECADITLSGFTASFSYSSIESEPVLTERGTFSRIIMGNSVPGGNIGDPQVPVTRELIAVPFGATPVVNVKSYTVTEYNLADYGIERIYPQQPSQSKSENEVKFAYNEAAYAAKGFDEQRPLAEVFVMGTMRGIQVGALQLNALRYNAASNSIRVYNNIELEVTFENADLELTEQTLVNTYSPYFRTAYSALFNERAIRDIYDEHPDLWATPVRILVIANRMFEDAMEPWLTWKTEKGFVMDVNYTDEIGTSASAIKTFITNKYNEGVANGETPTFLIIVGDKNQVPGAQTGSATQCVTDLYYYAVAGGANDYFADMYHSRFTCETVAEFEVVRDKSLMYEQYTMPDPSYLGNTLLIAGWDATWNPKDGKPTIQYAMNYYYNEAHGFNTVYNWLEQPYTGCYEPMNTGVNFVNYTAHGSNTSWADPSFTNSNVNSLTNQDKYFWAMGNCCQAADWGISGKCLGETFIITPNKGAFAYIGSCPSSYWYEDYYFAVGATNTFYAPPTYEESSMGCYDAQFQDDFNSISAVPFVGNLAVAYSHAGGYQGSVSDQYYWESYHVLGDGSICPYHVNPIENTVNHLPTLPIGMDFYTVEADPGSYVGISKDGVLYGAGEIGEDGTADIPMTPITSGGTAKIVVTHPQRQPYIAEVPAAAMNGAYVAIDNYAMNVEQANYGETIDMDITLKNVGTLASGSLTATLTTECEYVDLLVAEGTLNALDPEQNGTIEGFQFSVAEDVPDKTKAQFHVTVTDGTDTWESNINIELHAPVLVVESVAQVDGHTNKYLAFAFKNTGTAPFYGGTLVINSCSPDLVFDPSTITIEDAVEGGQTIEMTASYTVAESVAPASSFEVNYNFTTGLLEVDGIFVLTHDVLIEDFESGNFGDDWTFSPANAWAIVDGGMKGTKCAKPTNQGLAGSDYSMTLTVDVMADGEMTFMYKVSSEYNYDKLHFYMDNQEKLVESGAGQWTLFTQPVTVGQHTFKWSYTKDNSVNSNDDCAYIDDIVFPIVNNFAFIAPATDLVAEVEGSEVTLTWTASEDADNYVVKRDGETIATVTETSHIDQLEKDGTYTYAVYAMNSNGQLSTPITATIVAEFDAIGEGQEARLSVYPNPANSVLNIVSADSFEYRLYNSTGQEMVSGVAQGVKQINVSNFSKGVYFLHVTTGAKVDIQKVVVE
ncbi:MAG: T9SS type A sorting domain-containing protein [Bacteroidales bacterium]|nr:T9SS type A sorting domain-containing protein [Bacteroidales bacterium]